MCDFKGYREAIAKLPGISVKEAERAAKKVTLHRAGCQPLGKTIRAYGGNAHRATHISSPIFRAACLIGVS